MKFLCLIALSTFTAAPALAQETRQLDSHEHGVGQLNLAFDGSQIAMELHAPGADIVGFEHAAESDEDLATIEAALKALAEPLDLFVLPEAARCSVIDAHAELENEEDHEAASHTEFQAHYLLNCENIPALTEIAFAYFTAFPNALELEVQVISDAGAQAFEVERDSGMLDLSDLN